MPLAYKTTLADIANPHRLMIVTDQHERLNMTAYQANSMTALKAKNYGMRFIEAIDAHKRDTDKMIHDMAFLYKKIGKKNLGTVLAAQPGFQSLPYMLVQKQAERAGLTVHYCDDPVLRSEESRNKTDIAMMANRQLIQQPLKQATIAIAHMGRMDIHKARHVFIAACYGPTAAKNFGKRHGISGQLLDFAQKLAHNVSIEKKRVDETLPPAYVAESNIHMAGKVHHVFSQRPSEQRGTITVGAAHVADPFRHEVKNGQFLHQVLKTQYDIDSVKVGFLDKTQIQNAQKMVQTQGMEPTDIDFREFRDMGVMGLDLTPAELFHFFAGTASTMTDGIHPNKVEDLHLDYLIVLPHHSTEDHVKAFCNDLEPFIV